MSCHARAEGNFTKLLQVNAGTVEFMVEPNGSYYFLEVNPRIQARASQSPASIALKKPDVVQPQLC